MGIKSINAFLKKKELRNFKLTKSLTDLSVSRMAIDATLLLFKWKSIAIKKHSGENILQTSKVEYEKYSSTLSYTMHSFFRKLQSYEITGFLVFDGDKKSELKAQYCVADRQKKKDLLQCKITTEREKISCMSEEGDLERLKKLCVQDVTITFEDIQLLKTIGDKYSFKFIVSNDEAEKTCCELKLQDQVDYVFSCDTDVYLFGIDEVVQDITGDIVTMSNITGIIEELQLTREQFFDFCILLGCDFNTNVKGIGPVRAYKLIQTHNTIEQIEKEVNIDVSCLNYNECKKLFTI